MDNDIESIFAGHLAGIEARVLGLFVKNLCLFAHGQVLKNQIAA
jgi:hypothetical protein